MGKSASEIRENVRTVRRFVEEAEKVKVVIPMPLKTALAAFETATDVGVAFENVCQELIKFEHDFEAHLARKYDLSDWQQDDQAWIERAAYARKHQARAVYAVLAIDNERSMASQLWKEWKPKIQEVLKDHSKSLVREFLDSLFGSK